MFVHRLLKVMILFPNAKINIGLHVLAKRPDGFHDVETVMVPLPFADVLEFLPAGKTRFESSGIPLDSSAEDNLVMKAYRRLQATYGLPPLEIYLHKQIPVGAGLGGGSADAAFMLQGLNAFFKLGLPEDALNRHAAALGSDCVLFIRNRPALATGRGEVLQPVSLDLTGFWVALVYPGFPVYSGKAYQYVSPASPEVPLEKAIGQPPDTWRNVLRNDFEPGMFSAIPEIKDVKATLYKAGAVYASMSGSGSAVYGLFHKPPALRSRFPSHYLVWQARIT